MIIRWVCPICKTPRSEGDLISLKNGGSVISDACTTRKCHLTGRVYHIVFDRVECFCCPMECKVPRTYLMNQ